MLAAIILTKNEEKHLERCIASLKGVASEIFIVDSHSTDRTVEIAERNGARVFVNPWKNYSSQLNWGLANLPITSEWILRVDADETISTPLRSHIQNMLPKLKGEISGVYVKRQIWFMGKWIKHGGLYPIWHLRIWRRGAGRCEARWMDEHIVLSRGASVRFDGDLIDNNLNNLSWWIEKHNGYSSREAIDMLDIKYGLLNKENRDAPIAGSQEHKKRQIKELVYARLPLSIRAMLYFTYRYVLLFGFLDGGRGLTFHFLQGFWYRFLVDAKISEVELIARTSGDSIREVVEREFKVRLDQ